MSFWNWLQRMFKREGMGRYEQIVQVEWPDLSNLIHKIAEREQRSPEDVEREIFSQTVEKYVHFQKLLVKWHSLSTREQEVAALTYLNYSAEDIAEKLFISPNTVKTHLRNVRRKYDVRNKEQLRELFKEWDFSEFDD
jgi:DNA-binding CsgD family transcriptional regulator